VKMNCPSCKRRVRIRSGTVNICRCGVVLDPFAAHRFRKDFSNLRCSAIREISNRFLERYVEEGEVILEFLEECAGAHDTRILALLTAVEIIRSVEGTDHTTLARRMVLRWPLNHKMRYMLSNCLSLSEERRDHMESLKQRMIGIHLEYGYLKRKGESVGELYHRMHRTMEAGRRFLSKEERYQNLRMEKAARDRVVPDRRLSYLVERMTGIADTCGLPPVTGKETRITCVVDTNAITDPDASRYFCAADIRFIAPEEVLLEVSRWDRLEWTPLELDHIEIMEVEDRVPPEIDRMYSRRKGREPSLTDKKVAALALETRADAIISADKDLSDSGLEYSLEKHYGLHLDVVHPSCFERWIERTSA